jgi:hypothetical protein
MLNEFEDTDMSESAQSIKGKLKNRTHAAVGSKNLFSKFKSSSPSPPRLVKFSLPSN